MSGQGSGSLSQQIVSYISYPFASCLPSSSRRDTTTHERQGLLSDANYDDSDAISLLSNIANRSRRQSRSSRRREEWNRRAETLGCGLFGRSKGQIQRRQVTEGDGFRSQHRRVDSQDSVASRDFESDEQGNAARSLTGSFGVAQESGDEDAGMLEDEDIAEISQSREEEDEAEGGRETMANIPTVEVSKAEEEDVAVAEREAQERALIKAKMDKDAEEYAKAQAEDAARLAAEEEALAAEEEAAIAKAKRRAERRAIKEGLLSVRNESQRERRRTEAEAEAAAGGFDFAEEMPNQEQDFEYRDDAGYGQPPPQYGLASGPDGYGYAQHYPQEEYLSPQLQQPEIVHHHHYYHKGQPEEEEQEEEESYDDSLLSPNFRIQELPSFPQPGQDTKETTFEEDEDDADIAGLTFSKTRKSRSKGESGSNGHSAGGQSRESGSGSRHSGSTNGQRQGQSRYEAHRRGSGYSNEGGSGTGGGSSNGKISYRDRPRRYDRAGSRSTGSGAGLREGMPSRHTATSPTIVKSNDQRAEAAAGGFEDFVPPSSQQDVEQDEVLGYRSKERRILRDNGSTSSSGQRRERRREGPVKTGLNLPRNPVGANVFAQKREDANMF